MHKVFKKNFTEQLSGKEVKIIRYIADNKTQLLFLLISVLLVLAAFFMAKSENFTADATVSNSLPQIVIGEPK